jgi:hypothetical protein
MNILSLVSQNLDSFYQIQTKCYRNSDTVFFSLIHRTGPRREGGRENAACSVRLRRETPVQHSICSVNKTVPCPVAGRTCSTGRGARKLPASPQTRAPATSRFSTLERAIHQLYFLVVATATNLTLTGHLDSRRSAVGSAGGAFAGASTSASSIRGVVAGSRHPSRPRRATASPT